jgi:hypothetical protein
MSLCKDCLELAQPKPLVETAEDLVKCDRCGKKKKRATIAWG